MSPLNGNGVVMSEGLRRLMIADEDVRAIVRLLGRVAGMAEAVPDRRRALVSGLAEMVDADIWIWTHSGGWRDNAPFGLSVIEGGWRDDAERNTVYRALADDEWNASLAVALDHDRPGTWLYDISHPGFGDGAVYDRVAKGSGFEHLMFSMHPVGDGILSGIGLHRRVGRPAYTPREVSIAHLVLGQVDWLHHTDTPDVVRENGLRHLRPREREVLLHALLGLSRKEIAARMALSEHTVGDYFKSLYAKLDVTSRGELMAKFLPGKR